MKITHVVTYPVRIPLKPERRMISSLGQHKVSDYVLVRVGTDAGIEGVGEATVMPRWSGETVWGAQGHHRSHASRRCSIGCDPDDIVEIDGRMDGGCTHNWFAKSRDRNGLLGHPRQGGRQAGVRTAGRRGAAADAFECRFSMGAYRSRARAAHGRGARGGRLHHDQGQGRQRRRARTSNASRIVREAIGPDREIVIDANCGWDAGDGHRRGPCAWSRLRVSLFEQPTPRRRLRGAGPRCAARSSRR